MGKRTEKNANGNKKKESHGKQKKMFRKQDHKKSFMNMTIEQWNEFKINNQQFIEFLDEKCETVGAPLSHSSLAKQYKSEKDLDEKLNELTSSIRIYRSSIPSIKNLDLNTKVKRLFALSASVDTDFLNEIRKNAIVEVDEKGKITRYESTDGSLKLKGNHQAKMREDDSAKESTKDDESGADRKEEEDGNNYNGHPIDESLLLKIFVETLCTSVVGPWTHQSIAERFKKEFESVKSTKAIIQIIRTYRSSIPSNKDLDLDTKVKQLFALSASVGDGLLNELRQNAIVEVDERNRIIRYESRDGNLKLVGNHSERKEEIEDGSLDELDEDETIDLDQLEDVEKMEGDAKSIKNHESVRMFLMFDGNEKIPTEVSFVSKNDSEKRYGWATLPVSDNYMFYSSHTASDDEKSAFLKFVAKKCETADSVLDFTSLVEEYKEKHAESTATEYSLKAMINNYRMTIHKERVDLWTKIRQSFALSASLNPKFLRKLQKVGSLFVDDLNQIIKFDSNDKSLSLQNNAYMEAVEEEKEREKQKAAKRKSQENGTDDDSVKMKKKKGTE